VSRFDVYQSGPSSFIVDCQSDFLDYLRTRFVVPLLPPELEPKVAERLNPVFTIEGKNYAFYPQFAATLPTRELGQFIASLADEQDKIIGALDMLITGH
jgi:toxin CcdB